MKRLGCRFSLDDFGAGLSSFGYLRSMNVDFLKIDGALVVDIDTDDAQAAMVTAINDVGHALGLKTVAEFVENEGVLRRLRSIGIDYGQGYYFSRPFPLREQLESTREREERTG